MASFTFLPLFCIRTALAQERNMMRLFMFQAPGTDHPALLSNFLSTTQPHWINRCPTELKPGSTESYRCQFRTQHTHPIRDCDVTVDTEGNLHLSFDEAVRALAPGQYAVLYDGEVCLGSAEITSVGPTVYDVIMNKVTSQYSSSVRRLQT